METLFSTVDILFGKIRKRVDAIMSAMTSKGSKLPARMKEKAWKKYGADHPDKKYITPMSIPFIILCTKYDTFKDWEPEKRKIVCRTLRTLAHINGASLQFVSTKDEGSMNRCRNALSHAAFKTNSPKTIQLDHNKLIMCPVGSDILADIGKPEDGGQGRSPLETWRCALEKIIPQTGGKDTQGGSSGQCPASDPKFVENIIDTMRSQKNTDLEKYREKARSLANKK